MQQTFDWSRAEQLGMLDRCQIPPRPGVSVSALKGCLRAIDSYGRGKEAWPSYDTLATATGMSVRTVKRAVRALSELSLLVIQRRGSQTLNHYRIVWTELALLVPGNCPERSATVSERSAMVTRTKCHHDTQNVQEALEETTTTEEQPVVVVAVDDFGLADAGLIDPTKTIDKARRLGLSDAEIRERIERWRRLPEADRRPGFLHNWLTMLRSYSAHSPISGPGVGGQRGDAWTAAEAARERIRFQVVIAGRRAGVAESAIEAAVQRKIKAAGL